MTRTENSAKPLTKRQRAFVDEYLVDLNATQAAIRAGYSAKTAHAIGWENLRKPEIAEAIQQGMAERAERTEITQDYVLETIKETVERCKGSGKEFQPAAVLRGAELLGRHLELFTDKVKQESARSIDFGNLPVDWGNLPRPVQPQRQETGSEGCTSRTADKPAPTTQNEAAIAAPARATESAVEELESNNTAAQRHRRALEWQRHVRRRGGKRWLPGRDFPAERV